ncbi:hypothetical protein T190607A01A_40056 [Tenacibaculum sp. 190524A05c]|uniref:Uncharacterized protein n=1 Tax=Tenacibaculum platacis TaxID=3137852 RepID=A0ABM9P4B6_9FLAO
MKLAFSTIKKYTNKLLRLLILGFIITLILSAWKAEIIYIGFYIFIWGIIPSAFILIIDSFVNKYNLFKK